MPDPNTLVYARHVELRQQQTEQVMAELGFDRVLIHSGKPRNRFLDDQHAPFRAHPPFVSWLPLPWVADCLIEIRPAEKPRLWYYQPEDFWHLPPRDPEEWWAQAFEVRVFNESGGWREALKSPEPTAIIGEPEDFSADFPGDNEKADLNPAALMRCLDEHRTVKTAWEREQIARANRIAVAGHQAAAEAFAGGASELEIHLRFLAATGQDADHLPYNSIVALNEHCAVLHYQHRQARPPRALRSFLMDAGADSHGYASDITRTVAASGEPDFKALIEAVDAMQLRLVEQVRAGQSYADLHLQAHLGVAGILEAAELVRMSPEAMVEDGITTRFLPHGLGHFIGVQVHDVAGKVDGRGNPLPAPEGHRFLRLTRNLQAGNVVTIEPGLYFIPALLEELKAGPLRDRFDWSAIDALIPLGGIRIEDDVLVTEKAPVNYTRDAWRLARAA